MNTDGNSTGSHLAPRSRRAALSWPTFLDARSLALLLVAAAGLGTYLLGLFQITPFGYTEGIYSEIAREMLGHGHWIVPHLDGAPYIEKPPLLYWLEAVFFILFGTHVWAARLVSVLAGLGACLFIWNALRRIIPKRAATCAVLILASSPGWILMAHVATFDMLLAATTSSSLIAFFIALEGGNRRWAGLGWVAAALAFLAKGPVGPVLVALVLAGWLIVGRRPGSLRRLFSPFGITGFILLAGGWSLFASLRQPGFLYQFFWVEQFGRFLGTRIPNDYSSGPWWYYLPWIFTGTFPWCLAVLLMHNRLSRGLPRGHRRLSDFGLLWMVVVVLFFSFSRDKAAQYLLPALPGLAIGLAPLLANWLETRTRPSWQYLWPFGLVILVSPLLIYAAGPRLAGPSWIALALCVAAGLASLALIRQGRRPYALKAVVLAIFLLILSLIPLEIRNSSHHTLSQVTATIRRSRAPAAPLVFFRHYDPFAMLALGLRRRPWIYAAHSAELHFAEKTQPERFPFTSRSRLAHLLGAHGAWLIADYRDTRKLHARLPQRCLANSRDIDDIVLAYLPRGCLTRH